MWPFKKSIEQLSIELAGKIAKEKVLLDTCAHCTFNMFFVQELVKTQEDIAKLSTTIKISSLVKIKEK